MRRASALIVVPLLLLTAAAPALAAPQPPPVAFDAQPGPGSATDPSGGWYSLSLRAGSTRTQDLLVHNTGDEPLELAVAAVDATTMAHGGASYAAPDEPARLTATWLELARPMVRLEPGERRALPFTVRVPADARPGDHLAGLSVAAPSTEGASATTASGVTTSLDLRTRRVVAVHVEVPGPAESALTVQGVAAEVRPPGPVLELSIENTGQLLTKGRGVVTLPGTDVRLDFALDTFVPATGIVYPLEWPSALGSGTHEVRVELEHDGGTQAWQGEVTVADEVVEEAAAAAAGPGAPVPSVTAASGGVATTTLVLAVVGGAAAVAGVQALARLARRPAA